jgi:CO/xanthine dehydrogenase Mo-binding subunit
VIDAGRVLNPQGALGVVIGGMCQGIGLATREALRHTADGRLLTDTLRTYKVMRPGEQPERYLVDFVETPQDDAPYGARALGEHGVLGIPAALANALARAAEVEVDSLPATPEVLWRLRGEAARG